MFFPTNDLQCFLEFFKSFPWFSQHFPHFSRVFPTEISTMPWISRSRWGPWHPFGLPGHVKDGVARLGGLIPGFFLDDQ
jgi:hypothetical protein